MSVYVAGSSDELDRARAVMDRYRAAGVEVTSTWVENITAVGAANPRNAPREERQGYAYGCIDQVRAADVLHWLTPSKGHGRGSYWEAALAWAWSKQIIASGDTLQSIFPALVRETVTDDAAIIEIIGAHARAGKLRPGTPGDAWGSAIARNPNAATPVTGPMLCTCAECLDNRANAARLGYAVAPATFHVVEPAVARTTTPQVDALLGAIAAGHVDPLEVTGVEDSAPLAVECEKSVAIGRSAEPHAFDEYPFGDNGDCVVCGGLRSHPLHQGAGDV